MTSGAPRDEKQVPQPERLLDHNYDGIQEYDNPLPRWWTLILLATVIYAALYWFNVPGFGIGKGRIVNYERDMAAARAHAAEIAAKSPPPSSGITAASLLAMAHDPSRLGSAKARFIATCAPCHRPDGGGNIGPNLTDDYWIHGGTPLEIMKTVSDGVPDKGMPTWSLTLKPEEIAELAAYVITLHDTHPPSPKEPQGVKVESEHE